MDKLEAGDYLYVNTPMIEGVIEIIGLFEDKLLGKTKKIYKYRKINSVDPDPMVFPRFVHGSVFHQEALVIGKCNLGKLLYE